MQLVEWKSNGGANFAGVLCYSVGLLMWVTSLPPVRKKNFELFYYTHQLYVVFIILMALHMGAVNFSEASGGIFLYMLDRLLRFFQSKKVVNIISASCFPCGTIKLVLSKPPSKLLLYPLLIKTRHGVVRHCNKYSHIYNIFDRMNL